MSLKKYTLLLLTLFIISSCSQQQEKEESKSGTTQTTEEVPLIQEETPPLPEVPTPEVTPIKERENTQELRTPEKQESIVPTDKKILNPQNQVLPSPEKEKQESSTNPPKVVRLSQVYNSPGGEDEIAFSITLNGDTIESVKTQTIRAHNVSQKYQDNFSSKVTSAVSGKTIDEASNISTIAGASLTTGAFKKALKSM